MYRTVTRLLGLTPTYEAVEGQVAAAPGDVTVLDHTATPRRTDEGTHIAVRVRVRNDGTQPRTVPVRVRFYRARWLGRREAALDPVSRATDRLAPGEVGTTDVGLRTSGAVSRYEVLVGHDR
ncbi:hypothetical protein [Halorarius halobius]|uniref:hypothetical protein n=1 Tax=Halorarius halobius TaxID=2962671 RepID=UPI0020CC9212|nr:hypothetical protein [Halorarius halobius]